MVLDQSAVPMMMGPQTSRIAPVAKPSSHTLLIFAGGRASRLGGANKALLEVAGRPLINRILYALQPLVNEIIVLAKDQSLSALPGVRAVLDPEPHAGVLTALANGLRASSNDVCLAVACDMPFVSRSLFEHLIHLQRTMPADVVIPCDEYGLQPLHAVYLRQPVLQAVEHALTRGDKKMNSYFGEVRVRTVYPDELRPFDPALHVFTNVNTPDELARAEGFDSAPSGNP